MFFRDIVGHEAIKRRLIESVQQDKIAHALLFCGVEGIGKLPLALAFARYVQCTQRTESDACGCCPSCRQHTKVMHPDMHYIYPTRKRDKGKASLSKNYLPEWRAMLTEETYPSLEAWQERIEIGNKQTQIFVEEAEEIQRTLSLKSYGSEYKIMLLWLPESMNEACANKLLKLIEEPPPKTLLLFVSNNPNRILPTIASRTQPLFLSPLREEEIATSLVKNYALSGEDATSVAHIANGSYRKAIELISLSQERELYFDLFIRLMRLSYGRKIKELKAWGEEVSKLGRERQKDFLAYTQRMVRENFIYNLHQPQLNYMTHEEANFATRFAPFIHERNVMTLMSELERAETDIAGNANAKLVLFDLSISLIMLLKS